ncbi:uncharacterized protein LOC120069556 [Benincasa hispida]|uniref:uncharacterized protein LOC120069556 n=1 Tax=Benincasa hispida TaxID=102211 RepID=UPI001901EFFF|nr:uncharacterized protein LOC120069556 [Benincasa hispida]
MARDRPRKQPVSTSDATSKTTERDQGESSHPQSEDGTDEQMMRRFARCLAENLGEVTVDPKKWFSIERLKALGASTFEGTMNPADAEAWFVMVEKCFRVMWCPEDRKVALATFLLQKRAEDWWRVFKDRRRGMEEVTWEEFGKAFHEKFYPQTFRDAKRNEFLKLVQGSLTVAEYEQKYTELRKYASCIIMDETERSRRFKEGLRGEIRTHVTASMDRQDFPKLVEMALRVEASLESLAISEPAWERGRSQKYSLGVLDRKINKTNSGKQKLDGIKSGKKPIVWEMWDVSPKGSA